MAESHRWYKPAVFTVIWLLVLGIPVVVIVILVVEFGWVFVVLMLFLLLIAIGKVSRGVERIKQHDRCAFCRAKLKKNSGKTAYAGVCAKCGRQQPWAKQAG
jgi:hypothetical protein